ncbi:MAG: hypothetical protein POELPBGB_00243 [Bacteroidia bacterium]|nr:hypothetical protein [Bacteroidia bacterium]
MLNIPPTDRTPAVEFNLHEGELSIRGKSLSEDAAAFYQPVIDSLVNYKKQPGYQTRVHIQLEYFNTSSSKSLLDIFRELEQLKNNSEVTIHWYYEKEDEDMLEVGQDYSDIVNLPFKMIEV